MATDEAGPTLDLVDLPPSPPLPAGELVGLLADGFRLRVVAALVLGHASLADVRQATGLSTRDAVTALDRLSAGGLVVGDGDSYFLVESAFAAAARAAAPERSALADHHPPDAGRVLRAFVRDGRLTAIPTAHGKRQVILDLLAQEFELGRRYPEREVNRLLRRWHDDTAALRRYLVDDGYLSREQGEYWRSGGSYRPDNPST